MYVYVCMYVKVEKSLFCPTYPALRPPLGGPSQNFSMKLTLQKLEGWGYCMVKTA